MAPRNKLTAQARHIWTLRLGGLALIILLALEIIASRTSPKDFTVHIPPDLSQGVTMSGGYIPKANVFAFAHYMLSVLNEWDQDGRTDFPQQIKTHACYLSAAFREELQAVIEQKTRDGELARSRNVRLLSPYTADHVNQAGNNTWIVWLDLEIHEYVAGTTIKHTTIRYPVRVIRDARTCNQMGLALDGYRYQPERIE